MTVGRVVVIGGGIAGVAAAAELRDRGGPDIDITIVEQTARLGGKIHTGSINGVETETGAETFLVRRREATTLAESVGLGDAIVHPAAVPAALLIDGSLRDMPRGTVMGIPADAAGVAPVLTQQGLRRLSEEPPSVEPLVGADDVSVGALVRARFGDEVNDRLVDPLLGGVYSGRADDLSVDVTIPQLAAAARRHTSLAEAVRACLPAAPPDPAVAPAPVFGSIEGGLSRLVEATATASGARLRLGNPVRQLERTTWGWRVVIGDTRTPDTVECDAVVLAVPARPVSRLLAPVSAGAAAELGVLDYASIGLVTMALPAAELPQRSGFLVPASEGRTAKAATFFSRKWPHRTDGDVSIVRISVGRYGQEQVLQCDDAELARIAHTELSQVLNTALPAPVDTVVSRWGGGLPQYGPGHLDRVRRARAALAAHPVALAGAAVDGVGIPACIASGRAAAAAVLAGGLSARGVARSPHHDHGREFCPAWQRRKYAATDGGDLLVFAAAHAAVTQCGAGMMVLAMRARRRRVTRPGSSTVRLR